MMNTVVRNARFMAAHRHLTLGSSLTSTLRIRRLVQKARNRGTHRPTPAPHAAIDSRSSPVV
jgi:hypothetical protein